jgi:CRP/FNR family transcriptional regulator
MPQKSPATCAREVPLELPEALAALAIELNIARGDSLFRGGDKVQRLYFVRHGEVAALRHMADGGDAVMMTARSGEFFGEPSLFVTHYTCEARALTDSSLIAWPLAAFKEAMNSQPEFALNFMRFVVNKLRLQCSRLERLRLKNADQRILHYLTCGADAEGWITLPGTAQEWACELGLEPATLYRTLAQMEKAGKIERDKRRVRLTCASGMSCARIC